MGDSSTPMEAGGEEDDAPEVVPDSVEFDEEMSAIARAADSEIGEEVGIGFACVARIARLTRSQMKYVDDPTVQGVALRDRSDEMPGLEHFVDKMRKVDGLDLASEPRLRVLATLREMMTLSEHPQPGLMASRRTAESRERPPPRDDPKRADKPAEKPSFNEAKMEEMQKVLDDMHGGDGVSEKDIACMKTAAAMHKEMVEEDKFPFTTDTSLSAMKPYVDNAGLRVQQTKEASISLVDGRLVVQTTSGGTEAGSLEGIFRQVDIFCSTAALVCATKPASPGRRSNGNGTVGGKQMFCGKVPAKAFAAEVRKAPAAMGHEGVAKILNLVMDHM